MNVVERVTAVLDAHPDCTFSIVEGTAEFECGITIPGNDLESIAQARRMHLEFVLAIALLPTAGDEGGEACGRCGGSRWDPEALNPRGSAAYCRLCKGAGSAPAPPVEGARPEGQHEDWFCRKCGMHRDEHAPGGLRDECALDPYLTTASKAWTNVKENR